VRPELGVLALTLSRKLSVGQLGTETRSKQRTKQVLTIMKQAMSCHDSVLQSAEPGTDQHMACLASEAFHHRRSSHTVRNYHELITVDPRTLRETIMS
jgi:hypothetical protein